MPDFVARYIGLAIFVFFAVIFKFIMTRTSHKQSEKKNKLIEDEREANFSRVHAIPDEVSYIPDITKLPLGEYNADEKKAATMQERALKAAERPMLRLDPPMSNIEIKRAFGATNLEIITNREENYENYIRALANWAAELIVLENYEDAEVILTTCVDMSALFFLPYSLLCDVYDKTGNKPALSSLRNRVSEKGIIKNNDMLFKKINDYIEAKLS